MKRITSVFIAICLCLVSIFCFGCSGDEEYVDTSNAVSLNAFDDSTFAQEQEARDDELGREHIDIPDDVETITIDDEEFIPIDSFDDIRGNFDKNYILKHDMDITAANYIGRSDKLFTGKFNGNGYKLYGERRRPLFGYIKDAEIYNFVISSELKDDHNPSFNDLPLFCVNAKNSSIKNIINYCTMGGKRKWATLGMLYYILNCTVENVINYGDVTNGDTAIVKYARGSTVKNCKNYGNISSGAAFSDNLVGAIVSVILPTDNEDKETIGSIVENCENYGNVIGANYVGGIVGRTQLFYDAHTIGIHENIYFTDLSRVKLFDNHSIIRNCTNYGNIYRNKDFQEKGGEDVLTVVCCFGGIAGLCNKIENCTNSGNIYGFESINPKYKTDYIGGVAGGACKAIDCQSTTKLKAAKSITHTGEICGYLIER